MKKEPINSTSNTNDSNSNNITDNKINRLRKKITQTPTEIKGVDDMPKNTANSIKLLINKIKQCTENLNASKKTLRKLVDSIGPEIQDIELIDDDLKEAIVKILEETTEDNEELVSAVEQQGGTKRYHIKYV